MLSTKADGLVFGAALLLLPTVASACDWSDAGGELRIEAGICAFAEIAESETIELTGRIATANATIRVGRDATLVIDDTDLDELRLLSTPANRAHIIAEAPARIVARGAEYLSFARNDYAAGVFFDIRSSDNVELDGVGSRGPVKYLLRAESEGFAGYSITPASGAELSKTGNDRVSVAGNRLMIPHEAGFRLHLDGDGPGELTVEVDYGRDVRTGVLAEIPIAPVSGAATITGYTDMFAARRSIAMNIVTDPSGRFRLRAFDQLCSSVKWSLREQSFFASGNDVVDLNVAEYETLILKCLAVAPE